MDGLPSYTPPTWGSHLQLGYVPGPGIKPCTHSWVIGRPLAHSSGAGVVFLNEFGDAVEPGDSVLTLMAFHLGCPLTLRGLSVDLPYGSDPEKVQPIQRKLPLYCVRHEGLKILR